MAKKAHASTPVEVDIQIDHWPIERLPAHEQPSEHSR